MRKYYSYLLFSFILLSLKLAECNIENNTLIFVVEIFRHGNLLNILISKRCKNNIMEQNCATFKLVIICLR